QCADEHHEPCRNTSLHPFSPSKENTRFLDRKRVRRPFRSANLRATRGSCQFIKWDTAKTRRKGGFCGSVNLSGITVGDDEVQPKAGSVERACARSTRRTKFTTLPPVPTAPAARFQCGYPTDR